MSPFSMPLCMIYNMYLLRRGIVITSPNPLSAVADWLFDIFAATLHNWRPFLHPQVEDAPCHGDRDTLIMKKIVK